MTKIYIKVIKQLFTVLQNIEQSSVCPSRGGETSQSEWAYLTVNPIYKGCRAITLLYTGFIVAINSNLDQYNSGIKYTAKQPLF